MPDGIVPPMEVQVLHEEPPLVVVFSHRPLSVPRTKTSMTPLLGEIAAGEEVSLPPRDVDGDQLAPFPCSHERAFALFAKRSRELELCAQIAGPAKGALLPSSV